MGAFLYVVFHNLQPRNAGLVDNKKDLNEKRSKRIFVRENFKKLASLLEMLLGLKVPWCIKQSVFQHFHT